MFSALCFWPLSLFTSICHSFSRKGQRRKRKIKQTFKKERLVKQKIPKQNRKHKRKVFWFGQLPLGLCSALEFGDFFYWFLGICWYNLINLKNKMGIAHFLKMNYMWFCKASDSWLAQHYIYSLKSFWLNISILKETNCMCLLRLSLKYFHRLKAKMTKKFQFLCCKLNPLTWQDSLLRTPFTDHRLPLYYSVFPWWNWGKGMGKHTPVGLLQQKTTAELR